MSDPDFPMGDCTRYSLSYDSRRGKAGYLTDCRASSSYCGDARGNISPGDIVLKMCGGPSHSGCPNPPPDGCLTGSVDTCYGATSHNVCQRAMSNYAVKGNDALLTTCCAQGDPNLRNNADCPPNYFPNSAACFSALQTKCVDPQNPSAIIGTGCDALATSKNTAIVNRYNQAMQDYCTSSSDAMTSPQCVKWFDALRQQCIDPTNLSAIIGKGCDALATNKNTVYQYNQSMKNYCTPSIDTMIKPQCMQWCKNDSIDCPVSIISDFCKDKMNVSAYNQLCGCYYPSSVYDSTRNILAETYNFPSEFLAGGRKCYFPACSTATIPFNDPKAECPDTNLTSCIHSIAINDRDAQVTNIQIDQRQDCPKQVNCNSAIACETGYVCTNNQCVPSTTKCSSTAECSGGLVCSSGICVVPAPSKSHTIWYILGAVICFIIVIVIIIYFAVRKKSGSSTS